MELIFHTASNIFYDNGVLKDEPENTLEKFMRRYARICNRYSRGIRRMVAEVRPYTRMQWIGNTEPTFIEDTIRNYAHRTRLNAEWADITLALAADFDSPGEIITRKAAKDKYISYPIPENLRKLSYYPNDIIREAEKVGPA